MKTEPIIDKTALIHLLQDKYRISVRTLRFIPTEWSAYSYAVTCHNGERYFLKLNDPSLKPAFAASSLDFHVPLTYQLHAKGILPYIPHPIPTQSEQLLTHMGDYLLVLYNYIDGTVVGHDGIKGNILARLASLLGKLHRSTPYMTFSTPFIDHFDIIFEKELLLAFDVLQRVTHSDSTGTQHLRNFLLRHKGEITGYLDRLKELQKVAKHTDKAKVICHTDLHGENLMTDDQGILYIMDWENAMIAPPEHDLFSFAGDDSFWDTFLPHYTREFGPVKLNRDLFAFYYYRRGLEDLADWIVRIMRGDGGDAQDLADLEDIEVCLGGLAHVEKTTTEIEEKLSALP